MRRICAVSSLSLVAAGLATAQSPPFTISSFNLTVNSTDSTYVTTLSTVGNGIATFTGTGLATQTATVYATGVSTRDRGLGCVGTLQLSISFLFDATNTLTIVATGPFTKSSTSVNLSFSITGGTGAFKGQQGAGTINATVTQSSSTATFAGTGSGALDKSIPAPPIISPSGIVPVFSSVPIIQPGSWISLYGSNFATTTSTWNGDFPTKLAGLTVTINGKNGFLWFVSPFQINVQAPDDTLQGCAHVVVTTQFGGTASADVMLQPQQPSFSLYSGTQYVIGEIPTPNLSGQYGNGTYDLAAPRNLGLGRPVRVGETVELFGVGFGPAQTAVPAGQVDALTKANPITNTVSVTVGGKPATVTFAGEVQAGLYQINITVPQLASGDQAIVATVQGGNPPVLFSANSTQDCLDPDLHGPIQAGCTVYLTVQ
jgi:uncharacterized protein (TIGR03437 family)